MSPLTGLHPLLLCYHCLSALNPEGIRWSDNTSTCPACGKVISVDLLNLYTLCRMGIEQDFGNKTNRYIPSDEKSRIEKLGVHYAFRHGWEPYFSFILTAALSGVIGNLAYDALKNVVKRLFIHRYSEVKDTINVDNHVEVALEFLQEYGQGDDIYLHVKHWIELAQSGKTDSRIASPNDQELDQLFVEIRRGFREYVAAEPLDQSSFKDTTTPEGETVEGS